MMTTDPMSGSRCLRVALSAAVVICSGSGCEQPQEIVTPVPTFSRDDTPETAAPVERETLPPVEPGEPEMAVLPKPALLPLVTFPTITIRDRKYLTGAAAAGRGMRFFLTFVVDNNPDQLNLQVTIKDRNGDQIPPLEPKQVGGLWGVDHFVPGVGLAGGPYSFMVSVFDPDRETWFPLSNWTDFQAIP